MAESGIPLGGRWLDTELAREFGEWTWDETGERHANFAALERWRLGLRRSAVGVSADRYSALLRLVSLITRRLVAAMRESLRTAAVDWNEVPVLVAGGLSLMPEFCESLRTELSGDGRAYRLLTVADPETAVVRGGLICSELASRSAA